MSDFSIVDSNEFNESTFRLIGKNWMLVTVRKPDGTYNFMTASWGGLGHLWNKDVCFAFVRPQRYTYEFAESSGAIFTFIFFDEEYRNVLNFCGTKSGRDHDKVKECGLTPIVDEDGYVYFKEAKRVICAKKMYADMLKEECFTDKDQLRHYKAGDFHKAYVCEVTKILENKR